MELLQETLAEARARRFVGRRAELAQVEAWFERDVAPTRLFAVSGMGGIGKSALLQQILRVAQARGAHAVWLDGSACTPTPTGFLDYLQALGPGANWAGAEREGGRIVWCIDNYDHLTVIESWLREAILARLPGAGALLVLASRQSLSLGWRADLGWCERIVPLRLSPFTQEEIREYTRRVDGERDARSQFLMRRTGGLPLAVTLAVAVDVRDPGRTWGTDTHTGTISAHLLREVTAPELESPLDALIVLPSANQELLARVLGRPLPGPVYRALGELSFVELTPHGLVLHAIARAHLAADLRGRRPEWFQELRRRAVRVLRDQLETAPDRRRVARLLLAMFRDILPYGDDARPAAVPDLTTVDRYRPEDRARLHELLRLHPWPRHSAGFVRVPHPLLDELIDHFPESLQVVRAEDGEPLAFFSALLMQRDSVALLLRHVDNDVLQRIEPRWDRDFERHTAETADTYCTPVGAVDAEHPEYSPTDLLNFVVRGFLSLLGERMRGITAATNAADAAALTRIGFQRLGPPGAGLQPDEIYELDLRRQGFGEWVERLSDLAAPQRRPVGLTAAVREALADLGNADALETGALARTLGSSGPTVRRRILALLRAQPPPAPLTGPDQRLLQKAFVERALGPEAAAEQMHVSRATYYRRLGAAVAALTAVLFDQAPL